MIEEPVELTPRLSPDGRWLATLVSTAHRRDTVSIAGHEIEVLTQTGQSLDLYRLDGGSATRTLHVEITDVLLGGLAVLDDGTVLCGRNCCRELCEWGLDHALRVRPLFTAGQDAEFYLRPDGRRILVLYASTDDESPDLGWHASALDLDPPSLHPMPQADDCNFFVGWSSDLSEVFCSGPHELAARMFRLGLVTGTRELVAREFSNGTSSSSRWIVWIADDELWKLPTGTATSAMRVRVLGAWIPMCAVAEHRFLCRSKDAARHAIIDVEHDLGRVVDLTLPLYEYILYSAAIDGLIGIRGKRCEIRSLDGSVLSSMRLAEP